MSRQIGAKWPIQRCRPLTAVLALAMMSTFGSAEAPQNDAAIEPGQIDERTDGLVYMPYLLSAEGQLEREIDPAGCEVRLAVDTNQDEEISFPCETPFKPPANKYRVWLDGPDYVSPVQTVLFYSGGAPIEAHRRRQVGVVPAGRIALDARQDLCSECVLRVIHLDTQRRWGILFHEFRRRALAGRAKTGVLMPVGSALAAVYDNEGQKYVSLSRPVTVSKGQMTIVSPTVPPKGSDFLAIVDRPYLISRIEDDDVELFLTPDDGARLSPDVFIPSSGRVIGIWYAVEGRYIDLEARSRSVFLEPHQLGLAQGSVTSYRGNFRDRPDLEIHIDLPESLRKGEIRLEVFRNHDRSKVNEWIGNRDATLVKVSDLPPELLTAVLSAPPWEFKETIDLSDGFDATVAISPKPIRVSGNVYLGDQGHPASVSFAVGRGETVLTIDADDDGHFESELFSTGMYIIRTKLEGASTDSMTGMELILSDTTIDIRVPDNRCLVTVLDADTGLGITSATVVVNNTWEGQAVSQSLTTDEDGSVTLPPVRPGSIVLSASAEKYLDSRATEYVIFENDRERAFELLLEPQDDGADLSIWLSNGSPAGGAEAQIVRYLGEWPPFWQGTADVDGRLSLPVTDGLAVLLVRHPGAGFLLFELPRAFNSSGQESVTLPKPGPPITIRAARPGGETVGGATVFMWLESRNAWVSNQLLRWLTWSNQNSTTRDGLWTGSGVPEGPVRFAAVKQEDVRQFGLDAIDALGAEATFPWPNPIQIPIFE